MTAEVSKTQTDCSESMRLAKRELGAFCVAVTERYGPEVAKISAEEWVSELEASDDLPASAREWRRLTIRVTTRLANGTMGPSDVKSA